MRFLSKQVVKLEESKIAQTPNQLFMLASKCQKCCANLIYSLRSTVKYLG